MHGKALALALLTLTAGLGSLAQETNGSPNEEHSPIKIVGDQELRSNACACLEDPDASGTPTDPYEISDWHIETDGIAIEIRDIDEEHFVIRDNTLEGDTGIRLVNTGDRGTVAENLVNFGYIGVDLEDSSTRVTDNTMQGIENYFNDGQAGVRIDGGSPTVASNYLAHAHRGAVASASSPVFIDNEFNSLGKGLVLKGSTDARAETNTFRLIEVWGVQVKDSAHARLISNEVREGQGGIIVQHAKLYMQNNTVTNQKADAVRFKDSRVKMFRNNISNNWRGAFGSQHSDVLIKDNRIVDNGDEAGPNNNAGLRLEGSEGRVVDNEIHGNDIGIRLDKSLIEIKDNEMRDNRWGMSIPYSSKASIPLMSGNTINGINVDGSEHASEQRIFYEEVGVDLSDQQIDSGHADDRFGTLFKQGAVVVYDSKNVTIEDNTFTYNDRGITIRESSFVSVQNNTFRSNNEAVVTIDSRTFIKENICDIEIDPPETVCFKARGGFTSVRANVVAHVSVGIHFDVKGETPAKGVIADNKIRSTVKAGLKLEGNFQQSEHDVRVENNNLEANVVGAVLVHFNGRLEANEIGNSTWAAVHLDNRANATFVANEIKFNARGVIDVDDCRDNYRPPCSSGVFISNEFKHNSGIAVHLKNGGSFQGDVIADNEIGARIEGDVRMDDVKVRNNAKVGVAVDGELGIADANFTSNEKAGLRVDGRVDADNVNASFNGETGIHVAGYAELDRVIARNNSENGASLRGSAQIDEANFSGNAKTGLEVGGTLFVVRDCEASFNTDGVVVVSGDVDIDAQVPIPDIPDVEVPGVPEAPGDGGDDDQDPLWMHQCNLVKNEEFALKANLEARVNATNNFWGKEGPKLDVPLFIGDNVVSANARVSPYYETRQHETFCLVPSTEPMQTNEATQGCL